jgi:glycosyltransferase involved in cell wall biosynthesis
MKELLFSVIVPIYKVEKYIRTCIDSIIDQSYTEFELILIDDGSPDQCPSICDEYAKKHQRIKVIHKENGGLVSARQAGIQVAKGLYSICVDSDDWLDKDCLEEFAKIIGEYNPDIICSGMRLVDTNESKNEHPYIRNGFYNRNDIEKIIFPGLIQDKYARCCEPNICSKAIRTSLYKIAQMNVNPAIRNGEDSTCTRQCFFYANSVYVVHSSFYNYRVNHASMTKNRKPFPWNQKTLVLENLRKTIDMSLYDFDEQFDRSLAHGMFNICVSQFYSQRKFREIHKDVCQHLNVPEIKYAIERAKFTSSRAKLMCLALKYKLTLLMLLYAKIR